MSTTPDTRAFRDLPVTVIHDWNRASAKNAIDQFDLGYFAGGAQLAEAMLRDDRIASTLTTRVLGLFGCDRKVSPPDGLEEDAQAIEAAETLDAAWDASLQDDVLQGLFRWCVLLRFCLAEILWEGDEDGWRFSLKLWHPMFVYWDVARRQFVVNTQDGPQWITPGDGKWFLWAPDGLYRGWIQAAIRSLVDPWMGRQFVFRDWQRYNELHGLPIVSIGVPSEATEEEKEDFFAKAASQGSRGVIMRPLGVGADSKDWTYELVEPAAGEWESFKESTQDCSTRISIVLLGQNLTTEVQGGAYAAAQVHNLVRYDYKRADNKSLHGALREQLFKPWAAFNYGREEIAPVSTHLVQPPDDLKAGADTLAIVATAAATLATTPDVDQRALLEKFEVPLLDLDKVPAPAPAPAQDPGGGFDDETMTHRLGRTVVAPPASRAAGQYVEDIASIARDKAAKAMAPNVAKVLDAINAADSYDELRGLLAQAMTELDPAALAQVTEHYLLLSQLAGRHAVAQDTAHDDQP
jgi:phage gp29-like protein